MPPKKVQPAQCGEIDFTVAYPPLILQFCRLAGLRLLILDRARQSLVLDL